jgi:hypothetical protein
MKHHHEVPGKAAMIRRQRGMLLFLAFACICWGVGTLSQGKLHYPNVWGGAVCAPFAIVVGLLVLVAGVRWRRKER